MSATTATVAILVTFQFAVYTPGAEPVDTKVPNREMSAGDCLKYIRQRVGPGESVYAFRRYKIGSSGTFVTSTEVQCVVF